jgi:hypothetical protein
MLDFSPFLAPYGGCHLCFQPIAIPGFDRSYCVQHGWISTSSLITQQPIPETSHPKTQRIRNHVTSAVSAPQLQQISLFKEVI